ncbi:MAG: lytic murein transglycosylase [Paracoccaceae bacterium]
MLRFVLMLALVLGVSAAPAQDRAVIEAEFQVWLQDAVWPQAKATGVSKATFAAAFADVSLNWKLTGLVFPGMAAQPPKDESQAEFRAPEKYFAANAMAGTAAIGRPLAAQHAATLAQIEAETGVPGRIVLAIWARESGYGRVPITYDAFQVLGTRAYASRGQYLTDELVAALKIAENGQVPVSAMKSSWAGALGQPQFMPASFLAYGADGDGDGRADIWGSDADTMASIANFLSVHDWVPGRDWGFEVRVPETISCALEGQGQGRSIADWADMGVSRFSGRAFPEHEAQGQGFLMMPAGRHGPAFIVTPNFFVLKRYNRSDLYALYVGNLGDRIQYGMGGFATPWDQMSTISRADIAAIQRGLEVRGYDVGGVDGLPGAKTRRAIGLWQQATGRAASCFPQIWMKAALDG